MVQASSVLTGIEAFWSATLGDSQVRVAILDGPVDRTHSCFAQAQLSVLPAVVPAEDRPGQMTAHGTHVASLVFGQHHSSIKGIAPQCQGVLIPIFSDQQPQVSQLNLARAITQAVEAGAHVINISGGQLTEAGEASDFLEKAVGLCAERNILIVAAAGNDGCDCLHVPAALETVLAVGAMDAQGQPLDSSNWGETYQYQGILAPGAQIEGAKPAGGVSELTGTSFATPLVSGVAALMLSWQRQNGETPDPQRVRSHLLSSALPCTPPAAEVLDADRRCLRGKLNIPGILTLLKGGIMSELQAFEHQSADPQVAVNPAGCGCETLNEDPTQLAQPEPSHPEPPLPTAALRDVEQPVAVAAAVTDRPAAISTPTTSAAVAPVNLGGGAPIDHHSVNHPAMSETITPNAITASEPPSALAGADLVFALGTLGYDFGTEARRDSFKQLMPEWLPQGLDIPVPANPYDARQMSSYLADHLSEASSLIWTLNLELTPIYAIEPHGSFAREIYARLQELLDGEVQAEDDDDYVERVSIPGKLTGQTVRLFSGQVVPVIQPATMRGLYGWKVNRLVDDAITAVEAAQGVSDLPEDSPERLQIRQRMQRALDSLLNRIYYDLRNLGQTSQERALNYAATNAFQTATALSEAVGGGMELDSISVEKSPYCRKDSDCWDVKLKFFDPENRRRARQVFRFTIDVSDIMPVTLGAVRSWRVPS